MKSLRIHDHFERQKIIDRLKDQLIEKYGDNLVALASEGSFARDEDLPYSDLELTVIVKDLPVVKDLTIRKIFDGLYVVVVFETKDSYINKYLDVSDVWYASGSSKLNPIIDHDVIKELNNYEVLNKKVKCKRQIENRWPFYQEITAKVFNSVIATNRELFSLAFPVFVKETLIILSYLNQTPYKTLGTYISQAKKFNKLPDRFDEIINILIHGEFDDLNRVSDAVKDMFSSMEKLLEKESIRFSSNKI